MKVPAHLETPRLVEFAGVHRHEAGRSDKPLNFLTGMVVVGHVEEDRRLR